MSQTVKHKDNMYKVYFRSKATLSSSLNLPNIHNKLILYSIFHCCTNKLPYTPTKNTFTKSKIRIGFFDYDGVIFFFFYQNGVRLKKLQI